MNSKALMAVSRYKMLTEGQNVTVALSGGADSVALLHFLRSVSGKFGIKLSAAHLNHSIRGEEADRDMEFCRNLCLEWNIPFFCEVANIPAEARRTGESVELCARRIRYEFLEKVSGGVIATAHTASDVAETVLFNLARGSGIKGMSGIPPVRGRIIRPLIFATRGEVEEYCRDNKLNYVTDSTNLTDEYSRNHIRLNVVPQLIKVNSSFSENAAQTAARLRDDSEFLELSANKEYERLVKDDRLSLEAASLHPALLSRVVARFLQEQTSVQHEHVHINKVTDIVRQKSGRASLKNGLEAQAARGSLRVFSRQNVKGFCVEAEHGINRINGYEIEISDYCPRDSKVNKMLLNGSIDCDKIVGRLVFRNRQEGEGFKPMGRGVTKSLKNIFAELDIPFEKRDLMPILADDKGILWVPGTAVAERAAACVATEKAIMLKVKK